MLRELPEYPWDLMAPYIATALSHPEGAVDLSIGSPVDPTPQSIQDAVIASADAHAYPTTVGTSDLRNTIVQWFARRRGLSPLSLGDYIAPLVPLGLGFGRLGNFINGELWGRVTEASSPWAMIFPQAGDGLARHPSQLYQMALEGIVLFVLVWWFSSKPKPRGAVLGVFLTGYGVCRFIAELAREPDNFLGLLALGWSMGQWLSVPMILIGTVIVLRSYQRPQGG
jgi:prolipoprotein diacylglyceryl transferase